MGVVLGDVKRVTIRVRDEGVGIPPRERRLVFRRFVRGSSARDLSAPGTGVGLAMVQHIVREHGGKIELRSPGRWGSTFLPGAARFQIAMTRILIVEDGPAIALRLEDDLRLGRLRSGGGLRWNGGRTSGPGAPLRSDPPGSHAARPEWSSDLP
ncbi:MAG: sensor histidine kinase [Bryobacterales bacterium]|nr:sensor histidine kinase [Bryobacterales bacterium]